jgi:hypothetical protein
MAGMRSTMCIGAALAALALGLSACGGDGEEPAAAAQTEQEKLRDAQVKFAQCMRENGVDLPDPSGDGGMRIQVGPNSGIEPEEFEKASKACEEYQKDIRPQMSEGDEEEFKERALAHARCMREHGIDFPDPQFSAEGGARIRFKAGSGVDPDDPDFKAAQEECGDLMGGGQTDSEQP